MWTYLVSCLWFEEIERLQSLPLWNYMNLYPADASKAEGSHFQLSRTGMLMLQMVVALLCHQM